MTSPSERTADSIGNDQRRVVSIGSPDPSDGHREPTVSSGSDSAGASSSGMRGAETIATARSPAMTARAMVTSAGPPARVRRRSVASDTGARRYGSTIRCSSGMITSVPIVAVIRPPVTATPTARRSSTPSPPRIASGSMPRIAVTVVMITGRKRSAAARAHRVDLVRRRRARSCSARSSSTTVWFTTTPPRNTRPMSDMMFRLWPVTSSATTAPARGERQGEHHQQRQHERFVERGDGEIEEDHREHQPARLICAKASLSSRAWPAKRTRSLPCAPASAGIRRRGRSKNARRRAGRP